MDQGVYVAKMNIEHFRRKLLTDLDDATRQQIVQLLAAEEAKLAALTHPAGRSKEAGPKIT